MEHLTFDYPAQRAVTARAHVGVVGSGDLEVLLSPATAMSAHVIVQNQRGWLQPYLEERARPLLFPL